jgi:hypothetical protein
VLALPCGHQPIALLAVRLRRVAAAGLTTPQAMRWHERSTMIEAFGAPVTPVREARPTGDGDRQRVAERLR